MNHYHHLQSDSKNYKFLISRSAFIEVVAQIIDPQLYQLDFIRDLGLKYWGIEYREIKCSLFCYRTRTIFGGLLAFETSNYRK